MSNIDEKLASIPTSPLLAERMTKEQPSRESDTEITRCSNDTISRQAAIDALNEQIEQCNKALGSFDISLKDEFAIKVERASLEAYKEQLENLPPVQPKRMKGRWLPDNNFAYEMRFVCSVCKESEVVPTIGFTKYKPIWDFCPNCGADMRGNEHGTD
jgi:rubrerythrin